MKKLFLVISLGILLFSCKDPSVPSSSAKSFKAVASKYSALNTMSTSNDDVELKMGESQFIEETPNSILLDVKNKRGFESYFSDVKLGDTIFVRTLVKGDISNLYMNIEGDGTSFHDYEYFIEEQKEGEWTRMFAQLEVPYSLENDQIRFYLSYLFAGQSVNVAELEFEIKPYKAQQKQQPSLHLMYDQETQQKLIGFRKAAFGYGIINRSQKQYLPVSLDSMSAKMKLKGDWKDHLKSNKWSRRLVLENGVKMNGMDQFSIQAPIARGFWKEFVYRFWCKREGLISPQYGFINVYENDIYKGVWAYEEHFTENMIRQAGFPNGQILRLDEDFLFEHYRMQWGAKQKFELPFSLFSSIKQYKSTNDIEVKRKAHNALNDYRFETKPVHELFNIESMAKYYAITSIMRSFHGLTWHNQRYFFNAETEQLEVIAFDGATPKGDPENWISKSIFGDFDFQKKVKKKNGFLNYNLSFFLNDQFLNAYFVYLEKYSQSAYLESFIKDLDVEVAKIEAPLEREWNYRKFDFSKIKKNAQSILADLESFKGRVQDDEYKEQIKSLYFRPCKAELNEQYFPHLLKLWQLKDGEWKVSNFANETIRIIALEYVDGSQETVSLPIEANPINEAIKVETIKTSKAIKSVECQVRELKFKVSPESNEFNKILF